MLDVLAGHAAVLVVAVLVTLTLLPVFPNERS
jgi:hypothetical protein